MLRDLGVAGALAGHSERRQYFAETDETTAQRAKAALDAGLWAIACVGETEPEREAGETEQVLERQVRAIAAAVAEPEGLVLAYEPVWAIGTGKTATAEQAQEAHAFIRGLLDVPILYGGSVKPENAAELLAQPDVDGALVGGASLKVDSFAGIVEAAALGRACLSRSRSSRWSSSTAGGSHRPAPGTRSSSRRHLCSTGSGRSTRTPSWRPPARRSASPTGRWGTPRSAT